MKQLILPSTYNGESIYTLPESDSHYLLRVQRKDIGYNLSLLDEKGNNYQGTIIEVTNGNCCLKLERIADNKSLDKRIILFQSIPKGKKIDLMIRQAVEIGVSLIVPIMAEHSIPTFNNESEQEKKRERWSKVIKEASQQSGTKNLTQLGSLKTFEQAIQALDEPYTGIFFHQDPLENRSLHTLLDSTENQIVLVIGPEGGLSKSEVKLLTSYNFNPAILGSNILRAETATTFALGAVQMILNEKSSWKLKK